MDFLKVAVIIAFIVATILTIKISPEIHQPMLIEDEDFKLVRISDTITAENIPTVAPVKVPQTEQKILTEQTPSKVVQVQVSQPVTDKKVSLIGKKIPTNKKQIPEQTKPAQTYIQEEITINPSDLETLDKIIKLAQEIEQPKTVEKPTQTPKPNLAQQPVKTSTNKNPYMTEQEEIIAWNKWRSNIHNQVMKDSNAGTAPFGTLFMFSFLVDKFGNVSNVKVECSNNFCMDIARNNLKPAIQNLQRKPILNFPKGTQRTSVVVSGSFLIGSEDRFSTPSNFSDIERVVH